MKTINNILINTIETIIDRKFEENKKKQTQIRPTTVIKYNGDNTYSVILDGFEYKAWNGTGKDISLYQNVWVAIPHGRLEDMHIYSLRK